MSLAQAVTQSSDLFSELIRNGILGLVLVALITGFLRTKPEHDRLNRDHESEVRGLKDEIKDLRERNRKLVDDAISRASRRGEEDR